MADHPGSHKPKPSDLGSGQAASGARDILTRKEKNQKAALQAKKSLGVTLTEVEKQKLAQFTDGHQ